MPEDPTELSAVLPLNEIRTYFSNEVILYAASRTPSAEALVKSDNSVNFMLYRIDFGILLSLPR
jgi:hypothetical protein